MPILVLSLIWSSYNLNLEQSQSSQTFNCSSKIWTNELILNNPIPIDNTFCYYDWDLVSLKLLGESIRIVSYLTEFPFENFCPCEVSKKEIKSTSEVFKSSAKGLSNQIIAYYFNVDITIGQVKIQR